MSDVFIETHNGLGGFFDDFLACLILYIGAKDAFGLRPIYPRSFVKLANSNKGFNRAIELDLPEMFTPQTLKQNHHALAHYYYIAKTLEHKACEAFLFGYMRIKKIGFYTSDVAKASILSVTGPTNFLQYVSCQQPNLVLLERIFTKVPLQTTYYLDDHPRLQIIAKKYPELCASKQVTNLPLLWSAAVASKDWSVFKNKTFFGKLILDHDQFLEAMFATERITNDLLYVLHLNCIHLPEISHVVLNALTGMQTYCSDVFPETYDCVLDLLSKYTDDSERMFQSSTFVVDRVRRVYRPHLPNNMSLPVLRNAMTVPKKIALHERRELDGLQNDIRALATVFDFCANNNVYTKRFEKLLLTKRLKLDNSYIFSDYSKYMTPELAIKLQLAHFNVPIRFPQNVLECVQQKNHVALEYFMTNCFAELYSDMVEVAQNTNNLKWYLNALKAIYSKTDDKLFNKSETKLKKFLKLTQA